MAYDLIIRNGTIVDGIGAPGVREDVAVKDGKIAARGRLDGSAAKTIDAEGQVVAPGIIDLHTHYDPQLTWEKLGTSSIWHGITTIMMGNCGLTLAPLRPQDREPMLQIFGKVEELSLSSLRAC
ncbi:MAG TPA: amidohydrolase family protein, partial [Dehalococcoidia bacterium]|nr:amidohydrolase family protein [Dehalococcoidia bacterium]